MVRAADQRLRRHARVSEAEVDLPRGAQRTSTDPPPPALRGLARGRHPRCARGHLGQVGMHPVAASFPERREIMSPRVLAATAATALTTAALVIVGAAGAGRPLPDNSELQPPPPPGAVCRPDGPFVICDTFLDLTFVNEPIFGLPCGTVYETSIDNRDGTR